MSLSVADPQCTRFPNRGQAFSFDAVRRTLFPVFSLRLPPHRPPQPAANQQRAAAGLTPQRSARFTAALALADPSGNLRLEVEGHCPGEILETPRGSGGFGYDPVFLVPETGLSFAEMDKATKARFGHRGRAFALLEPGLRQLLG
jgi:hypothetical protein